MSITLTWLRLDTRRRWRSLLLLCLLVAVATTTVLTAVAGARRGQTAFDRLWARTLPATVTVLPNQPGFDWSKVRALPGVTALGLFAVYYGDEIDGLPAANIGFPPANAAPGQTVERPVVLRGRLYNPARADEVDVSPHFDIMGHTGQRTFLNALVRLGGGEAAIPAFRVGLARVTGRSDIDVWDNYATFGGPVREVTGYEALWLLAFGIAALLAACILVGQSIARHVSGTAADLQVLRAVGMARWEMVASACAPPVLATAAGATVGVAGAVIASLWTPIGVASLADPSPGIDADWLVLGVGWAAALLLAAAGTAAAAWTATSASRGLAPTRGSAIAAGAAAAGLPVPVVMGTRFALEAGRGRSAVPVRPALAGVVVGVLGVVAAFTFYAGVRDAAANPARFGQTWQLETFMGENGQDFGPAGKVLAAIAASPGVTGVIDTRVGGAQSGQVSVESFSYGSAGGKQVLVVLTAGRMPATADDIVLAPTTAKVLHAGVATVVRLRGGAEPRALTVTGIAFVPAGPHNNYDEGAWLTPAGFARLFHGAHYRFKYHLAGVALRPGADAMAAANRLDAVAAGIKGGAPFTFTPPQPLPQVQIVKDVAVLPLALSGFLALLAAGAVGHALAIAVRRRRRELAVLRALGLTRLQARMVVVTHGTVLAGIGLVAGVPLGIVLGRGLWRVVAEFTPLAYRPPVAIAALLLTVPVTVLAANLLAVWPGQRAARLRPAQVLHTE